MIAEEIIGNNRKEEISPYIYGFSIVDQLL